MAEENDKKEDPKKKDPKKEEPKKKVVRVVLKLNIGTEDQKRLDLPKTEEGEVIEVGEKTADILRSKGWAADAESKQDAAK